MRGSVIKRDTDYALWSLAYMADFPKGQVFGLGSLGRKRQVSTLFLRKIFQKLAKKKIVISHRGRYGGFSLAHLAKDVSIRSIIEAVQGPIVFNRCLTGKYQCPKERTCVLKKCFAKMQSSFVNQLSQFTLASLQGERVA